MTKTGAVIQGREDKAQAVAAKRRDAASSASKGKDQRTKSCSTNKLNFKAGRELNPAI